MMLLTRTRYLALALPALLAACGSEREPEAARAPQGTVLGRTITDDMLPLFEARSQPPFEIEEPSADVGFGGDPAADAGDPASAGVGAPAAPASASASAASSPAAE